MIKIIAPGAKNNGAPLQVGETVQLLPSLEVSLITRGLAISMDSKMDLGTRTSNEIASINAAIFAGSTNYPIGSTIVNSDTGETYIYKGIGTAARFVATGRVSSILPSNWFATQEFSNTNAYTGNGSTFGFRRSVPFPFYGGRLIVYSSGAKPVADCGYGVGTVATAAPTTVASNFVVPTFGGGYVGPVAANLWQGTSGVDNVEFALSDPFPLQSIARTDGGTGYCVEGRVFVNTGVTTVYSTAVDMLSAAVELITAGGPSFAGFSKGGGDFATTNQSGFTSPGTATNYIFGDLLLYTDSPVYTVAAGGDSISKGQGSTDGRSSEIKLACDSLTLAGIANVNYLQHTRPGKGVDNYATSDINFIRKMRPNIFFYTPNSPNDSGLNVAATLTKTKNWLGAVKQACDEVGTKMVLCTSTPWAPFSAAQDGADQTYYATLRTLAATMGIPYHDRYALTTTGTSPSALLPGYAYPTGTANQQAHPNGTCYAALSPYVQAIIRDLIGK